MFRKLIFLLTISLIAPILLSAQEQDKRFQVKWGKETTEPSNTMLSKIVSWNKAGFYAVRLKANNQSSEEGPSKVFLERYDPSMNLVKSRELDLKYKKKKRQFEDLLMIGGNLYFLTSFNNMGKRINYLFAQKVNLNNLQVDRDLQLISQIPTRNKYRDGAFKSHISRDSNKVLIYSELPYKKNEPERFALNIFDNQLQELWDKDIALPYDDNQFVVEDYQIDNQGNVYLLGVLYQDAALSRRKGLPNYKYIILAYNQLGEKATKYKIDLNEKFITDLTFRIADNGELICSGFYSDVGTYSTKGTYFFKIDPKDKRVYNTNAKELDFDFRTEYVSDRKKDRIKDQESKGNLKRSAELYSYSLDHLILRNDGGALLIAEQYYVEQRTEDRYFGYNSWNNRYSIEYFYNYNDIIVVNIKPDGEVEWAARIPKQQETRNDGGYFSSYAMSIVRDKIYFIYNDNARNFSPDKKPNRFYNFDGRNSIIALSTVYQNGDVETVPLFQNSDANVLTRPKVCRQIGKKEMAVYGERGRRSRFGKLRFD